MTREPIALRRAPLPGALDWLRGTALGARLASIGRERLAVVVTMVVAVLARVPTLGIPLDEFAHPFRQTQTAYLALLFHEHGIDLFHAKLPILGPPFQIPLEFPLFQAAASLVMDVGVAPDLSLRLTALACFCATALLLWALVRRVASPVAAFAALAFFLFSPFALVWSRAELIEYLATATALGWVLAGIRWREGNGRRWWLIACACGSVALLVKVTTGAFWVLPLLAFVPAAWPGWRAELSAQRRRLVALAGLAAVPFAIGAAWTWWADGVKAATPLTAWLTSSQLVDWNFGTVAQRMDASNWYTIVARAITEFGGPLAALFFVGAVVLVRQREQRRFWLAVLATAVLPIAVFFNLYLIHDYYLVAVSPAIAMVQGLLVAYLLKPLAKPVVRRAFVIGLTAFTVISLLATRSYFWGFAYADPGDTDAILAEAAEVDAHSLPTDLVMTEGRDWSPSVLYFARREGLAVPNWLGRGDRTDLIDPSLYHVASFADPQDGHLELLARWPLVGVTGLRTYVMGTDVSAMRDARMLGADAGALALPTAGRTVSDDPLTILCDGVGHPVPAGASGTWLELDSLPQTARLFVDDGFAAVPARPIVVIDPAVAGDSATLSVGCSGAPNVTIGRILDAPLPR